MANLKALYSLVKGYPFSYEAGEVTALNLNKDVITVGGTSYDIAPGSTSLSIGDNVEKFQILSTGVQIRDWISHQSTIESLAGADVEERLVLNLDSNNTFPHSTDLLEAFKRNSIPAGLRLIET